MKHTPQELEIQQRLQPGAVTMDGFLGDDTRFWTEIVAADAITLEQLQADTAQLAARMQYFTDAAFEHYEGPVVIDGHYQVQYDTYRGFLISPFKTPGRWRKGVVTLTNLDNNITIRWTPLNIHLIGEHGFFNGIGANYRIEPETLVKALQ